MTKQDTTEEAMSLPDVSGRWKRVELRFLDGPLFGRREFLLMDTSKWNGDLNVLRDMALGGFESAKGSYGIPVPIAGNPECYEIRWLWR